MTPEEIIKKENPKIDDYIEYYRDSATYWKAQGNERTANEHFKFLVWLSDAKLFYDILDRKIELSGEMKDAFAEKMKPLILTIMEEVENERQTKSKKI